MSYQDRIDKKETLKLMRKEMADFSDLYQLYQDEYTIKGFSYDSIMRMTNYLSDPIIHKIQHHDEQRKYITKIIQAMAKLKAEEMQLLYLKYILLYSDVEIEKKINASDWYRRKLLNSSLLSMALILNNAIYIK